MSAEDQGSTQSSAPVDNGPTEIYVGRPPEATSEVKTEDHAQDNAPDADSNVEVPRDDGRRQKSGFQDRVDELTKARREAEREAAYWKARAMVPEVGQAPAQKDPNQPPSPENFSTQEEYIEALTDYKLDQKLHQRERQQKQAEEINQKASSWDSRLSDARRDIPDYDEVVNSADIPVANHVVELLMEHDQGAKIVHHLAKNTDLVDKLNGLSSAKAAFEIAQIAQQFVKSETTDTAPVKERNLSKAPPPAKTIGQGRSTTPNLSDMSMEDYVKQRRTQGASWAR